MKKLNVIFWGTYDTGKPRIRIILKGLKLIKERISLIECHYNCWKGIEDKSRLKKSQILFIIIKTLFHYPFLIFKYLTLPRHDIVLVGYWGLMDILIIYPFVKLRRAKLVWDFFIPMYDTVIGDRKLLSKRSLTARLLYFAEKTACKLSSAVFCDTAEHAVRVKNLYKLHNSDIGVISVGAETDIFKPLDTQKNSSTFEIFFYGQFIPLHGIETIVEAARSGEKKGHKISWTVAGQGQEAEKIDTLIEKYGIISIKRIDWIPYKQLNDYINRSHVSLGIFGTGIKAQCVIPNKVYQICAAGAPIITADTPAIRELLSPSEGIKLVRPGNPEALLSAVMEIKSNYNKAEVSARNNPVIGYKETAEKTETFLRRTAL